jgi:signal peptidase
VETFPTLANRAFGVCGIAVTKASEAMRVSPLQIRARTVRDGHVIELDVEPFSPSPLRRIVNAASLFVFVLCIGLCLLALAPFALGYRQVVVGSGSMAPSLNVADIVVVDEHHEDDVGVGTVIDYDSSSGARIHRVIEVLPDGYLTKGDANQTADSDVVRPDVVSGVGVFLVPYVGLPYVWYDNGEWLKLGGLVGLFVAAGYFARTSWLRPGPQARVGRQHRLRRFRTSP